jgi:hypothetical protein
VRHSLLHLKGQPASANRGDRLVRKASWTKGKKACEIPIRTAEQRTVLDRAHRLAGKGSLIPADRTYIQQLKLYERQTARAGLPRLHGLRHAYAQQRYQELTGWRARRGRSHPDSADADATGAGSGGAAGDQSGAGPRARPGHHGLSRPLRTRDTVSPYG